MKKIQQMFFSLIFLRYLKKNRENIKKIDFTNTKNIDIKSFLIISSTALGDTVLSTPAIRSLRDSFPDSRITVLIYYKYIELFKSLDCIDETIPYHGGYKKFFHTLEMIRQAKPEAVLILHGNGPQDIQLAVMSGASYILKHPTSSPLKHLLSCEFVKKDQHTIEDRLDLVRKIGGTEIKKEMEVAFERDIHIAERYARFKDAVGFQMGAANIYKMWPAERFIELAGKILQDDPQQKIVITGISGESDLAEKIVARYGEGNIINMCGKCSIEELPYLIERLKVLITNDTGTLHLAVALKIPTISLFSPTSSQGIGPYQDREMHTVIQKDGSYIQKFPKKKRSDEAMKLISTEEVFSAYKERF